jgi:hypothetical protein
MSNGRLEGRRYRVRWRRVAGVMSLKEGLRVPGGAGLPLALADFGPWLPGLLGPGLAEGVVVMPAPSGYDSAGLFISAGPDALYLYAAGA